MFWVTFCSNRNTLTFDSNSYKKTNLSGVKQGFCLAVALGLSPKIVPDVPELAVQFGQFVRDDFRKCTRYGNAVMQ